MFSGLPAQLLRPYVDVPVDPDAPDARRWLIDELGKPEYAAARPSLLDRIAEAIRDWLSSVLQPSGNGDVSYLPLVVTVIVVAGVIVAAFFIFGRPRLRRAKGQTSEDVFGKGDQRGSAELRSSAQRAAADGNYVLAIEEMFRALARQLAERTIVAVGPGSTAQDVATRAGMAFPDAAQRLAESAAIFDGVRYLDAEGERRGFDDIAALDSELRSQSPARLESVAAGVGA